MPTCARCKAQKTADAFFRRSGRGGVTSLCKACNYDTTMARQHSMKEFSIAYKGGRCASCGYSVYPGALEFHHRDPATKEFSLGKARLHSLHRLKGELDKCDLLCVNCHREVHQRLGTVTEQFEAVDGARTRNCPRCGEAKPLGAFYRRRDGNGVTAYCKPCTKNQTVERQQRLKTLAIAYKGGKCVLCGYSRSAAALEFHHRDPSAKEFHLAKAKVTEFESVKSELDKCELLCANCHREVHARQLGLKS